MYLHDRRYVVMNLKCDGTALEHVESYIHLFTNYSLQFHIPNLPIQPV